MKNEGKFKLCKINPEILRDKDKLTEKEKAVICLVSDPLCFNSLTKEGEKIEGKLKEKYNRFIDGYINITFEGSEGAEMEFRSEISRLMKERGYYEFYNNNPLEKEVK